MEVDRETEEEVSTKRTREEKKEENETVIFERRCLVSTEAFDNFSQEEDSESCGNSRRDLWDESFGLSGCVSVTWTGVFVVADVLVLSYSMVVMSDAVALDWNFVEPQSFSLSKKRSIVSVENHEDMSYEGKPSKAPPTFRRRMPPTQQQSPCSSIEATQWQTEMEDQGSVWNAPDSTVIAKMEQYPNDNDRMKLEIEELERLLGPEDSEVNLRHVLRNTSRRDGRIFEIFSSKEKSEHLVASNVRLDVSRG